MGPGGTSERLLCSVTCRTKAGDSQSRELTEKMMHFKPILMNEGRGGEEATHIQASGKDVTPGPTEHRPPLCPQGHAPWQPGL